MSTLNDPQNDLQPELDLPSTSSERQFEGDSQSQLPSNNSEVLNDSLSMRNLGCWFYCKFIYSIIGLLLGINIFFVFFFLYHNYNAALWGFATGVFAAGVVQLHILYIRRTLEDNHNHSSLTGILWFGVIGIVLSLAGIATYVALAVYKKQDYKVEGDNYYPAAMFSFFALKYAVALAWTARHYRRVLAHSNPALLGGVRAHPDSETESIG